MEKQASPDCIQLCKKTNGRICGFSDDVNGRIKLKHLASASGGSEDVIDWDEAAPIFGYSSAWDTWGFFYEPKTNK